MNTNSDFAYEIKLPQFEGPFDLLLFFIERDELDIHDIPIAKLTDDFLGYIQEMQALNIELASEFIFMAASLMRIKVKTLLPRIAENENGDEADTKEELIHKLLIYKQFKEICITLSQKEEERSKLHKRGNMATDLTLIKSNSAKGEELSSFDLYKLMLVYERVMSQFETRTKEARHTVVKYPYTIEQQKKVISDLVSINRKLDFGAILEHSENKIQFVYNFLAILEMLQQELLEITTGFGYNNFWVSKPTS